MTVSFASAHEPDETHERPSSQPSSCRDTIDLEMQPITQARLNDLVRDIGPHSKQKAELLASRLNGWQLLAPDACVTQFRARNKTLKDQYMDKDGLCVCVNVNQLFESLCGEIHNAEYWRLFIDSGK